MTPRSVKATEVAQDDSDARLDRLDALTDWDRQRLLAYLDGRAPGYVDEWFEKRRQA